MLLMVGLLLGPGYYVVARYLSGEPGVAITLTDRAAHWTLADGTILHFLRGQAYRPVAIELDPKMNRIAFELGFEFPPVQGSAPLRASEEYAATLLQADQPILQRTVTVPAEPGTTRNIDVGSIEVYYPGSYTFILEGPDSPRLPASKVTVQVRQKIEPLSLPFFVGGRVVLVVGLALSLEPYLPRRRRH
jgi:hypothetical protein